MPTKPTYTADEILQMCLDNQLDNGTVKILIELVDDELNLYDEDELTIILRASMICWIRSLLRGSIKNFTIPF